MEYSPFVLDIENATGGNILATCRDLGVAVVCYSPLGRGLITSTFAAGTVSTDPTDVRSKFFPRLLEENRATNVAVVNEFAALAAKKGCTTSQLALAWLLKQGNDIFPIPGTKKIKYLEENWGALDVELSEEDEREVRSFVERAEVVGPREPERYAYASLVDTREEERVT